MEQVDLKIIAIAILALIVIYMIMRRRTENLKRKQDKRSRFRRDR
jgi:hypothetical protein